MALIPLNNEADNSSKSVKDLPWLNVYAKGNKNDDKEYIVRRIYEYDSGLMVMTDVFKAFVHEGSNTEKQLLEALGVYVEMKSPTGVMVGKIEPGRKLGLYIDNERLNHYWHKTENRFVQVMDNRESPVPEKSVNPFLAGMGVLSIHSAEGNAEGEEPQETRREALRKGKKGVQEV